MTVEAHAPQLYARILDVADWLEAEGQALPEALKRRDKREPGRRRKEEAEYRLIVALRRLWRRQAQRIREKLERRAGILGRKTIHDDIAMWMSDFGDDFWAEEDGQVELVRILTKGARDGVLLFEEMVPIGIDYTLTNREAALAASKYTSKWLEALEKTTQQALRDALGMFIRTPGFTVGDVMDLLPFDEVRARRVATTEITRMYALGQQTAGEQLAEEFPGVRVVKIWFTSVDDRVCDICGPLHEQEVEIHEQFEGGYDYPPAHPACRCYCETTTRLGQ